MISDGAFKAGAFASGASDLDVLQIEIEIWATDDRQRVNGPDLVIASSSVGSAAAVGTAVPDDLAAELVKVVTGAPPMSDLSAPPMMLEHCRQLLEDRLGRIELRPSSGPSYLIPESRFDPRYRSCVRTGVTSRLCGVRILAGAGRKALDQPKEPLLTYSLMLRPSDVGYLN